MGLRAYVIRRILLMIPTLIGVTLLIFAVLQLFSPSQRAGLFVQDPREAGDLGSVIEKYGLNDPVYIQYVRWINNLIHGDLGWSETANGFVLTSLVRAIPATIELVMFSIPIIVFLGIQLGVLSATHRNKPIDHITRFTSIIGWSLPTFWFGMILIAVFSGNLHLFHTGRLDSNLENYILSKDSDFIVYTGLNTVDGLLNGRPDISVNAIRHIVLPTTTLVVVIVALIVRVMRSSMLEALSKGYITAARAKGLDQKEVINKHAKKNAMIPTITLAGMLAAGLLTGVVITETVFTYKGVGFLAANAAIELDIPMVLGFSLFVGVVFVVANLLVDITYAYIDPRIRLD